MGSTVHFPFFSGETTSIPVGNAEGEVHCCCCGAGMRLDVFCMSSRLGEQGGFAASSLFVGIGDVVLPRHQTVSDGLTGDPSHTEVSRSQIW